MKTFSLILIFKLSIVFSYCQYLEKGVDNNPILNKQESEYFNNLLKTQRMSFNFNDKKTAFVSLYLGINLKSKNDYFNYYYKNNSTNNSENIKMLVLDSIQHQETNGYDILIFVDSLKKELTNEFISKIIGKISECEKNKPEYLYQLGLDVNPTLTNFESNYFNTIFKDHYPNYDFTNLKIGFFHGSAGSTIQSKKEYFNSVKNRLSNCYNSSSMDFVIKLTNEEKIETNGYEFIIVSWSKLFLTKASKTMIKKLKTNNSNHQLQENQKR